MQRRNFGPRHRGRMMRSPASMLRSPMPSRGANRGARMINPRLPTTGESGSGGGLLEKVFQRQAVPQADNALARFSRAAPSSGTLMDGLKNPGTIQTFLNNTQQVLKTAQQIGPIVQQYGPIVKNLPAMWKLYKGFQSSSEESATNESIEQETESTSSSDHLLSTGETDEVKETSPRPKGTSTPKLYI